VSAPIAGYSRVSRVGDRDDTLISPELQVDRIDQYAASRGLSVEHMEPELDVSGGKVERPVLERAIEGVEHGRYSGVIVADIDRLSRMNLVDALHVIQRIENAGGQVIAVAQNFDASTPEGEWARNVWLSTANMMLKRYGLQFRAAKASAVERGVWPTNTPPIGYTVTRRKDGGDGQLKVDEKTAPKVRAAFEARAEGRPWAAIAEELGVGLSHARKIVTNRVYLGEVRLGEWVNKDAHEPLVDRAMWEAAQIHHPPPARRGGPRALLAGLVRCAGCQGTMTPDSTSDGWAAYRCKRRPRRGGRCSAPAIIARAKLDEYVEGVVLPHIEALQITARERTASLDQARARLSRAESELASYYALEERVSEVGADAFIRGARERERVVEEARADVADAWQATQPAAFDGGGTLGEVWPKLTVEQRRHVLSGALGVVWVRKGNGPAADRARVIATGFEPVGLDVGRRVEVAPLDWVDDLPGEVRAQPAA
jgi:site-specific DNA recombinase